MSGVDSVLIEFDGVINVVDIVVENDGIFVFEVDIVGWGVVGGV